MLKLNQDLMQLDEVDIPGRTKQSILQIVQKPISRLGQIKFLSMTLDDTLNLNIKNPQLWLKDTFGKLDTFAMRKDNESK